MRFLAALSTYGDWHGLCYYISAMIMLHERAKSYRWLTNWQVIDFGQEYSVIGSWPSSQYLDYGLEYICVSIHLLPNLRNIAPIIIQDCCSQEGQGI